MTPSGASATRTKPGLITPSSAISRSSPKRQCPTSCTHGRDSLSSTNMPVPNRPTTGQKATITRGLNLQAATKKDVQLLDKRIDNLEKHLAKSQKEILRAIKKSGKRRRGK
jgi:hypothetical protein